MSKDQNDKYGVKELYHPTGGPWGSCYIDDRYIKLFEDIFSKDWIKEFKSAVWNY